MSETLTQLQLKEIIANLNREFGVHLLSEDFRSTNYSLSSLRDILVQKISDELNGEWTTDMAFHKIKTAISHIVGKDEAYITQETELDQLFPSSNRRKQVNDLSEKLGFKLDILKPNGIIYGFFIFLFFACIPIGIGMDWFLSGIGMIVCAIIIFILGKTGNTFRMKTVGHLADHLAWKNYLKQKRKVDPVDVEAIRKKVMVATGS